MITVIDFGRKNELLNLQDNCGSGFYIQQVNHFTSPGLETLREEIKNLPEKVLTEEEIHKITQKCIKVGVAKTLYTLISANNNLVPQFNTLFSLTNNPEYIGSLEQRQKNYSQYTVDTSSNKYKTTMDEIQETIGEDWLTQFNYKTKIIHKNKFIQDKTKAIFHDGLIPHEYSVILNKTIKLEDNLKKLLEKRAIVNNSTNTSELTVSTKVILSSNNVNAVLAKMRESQSNNNKLKI